MDLLIQERINNEIKMLTSKARSGRTTQMVSDIFKQVVNNKNQNIVVFTLGHDLADSIMRMLTARLPQSDYKVRSGGEMIVNNNTVIFRDISWQENPGFKYQKWDNVYIDNSVEDQKTRNNINMLQSEL